MQNDTMDNNMLKKKQLHGDNQNKSEQIDPVSATKPSSDMSALPQAYPPLLKPNSKVCADKWSKMVEELLKFKGRWGHCLVPNRYEENPQLGSWVSTQRRQYKQFQQDNAPPMTQDRIDFLESIGFVWATKDPRHVPWNQRYEQLKEYKKEFGDTLVPIGFHQNPPLANWVSTQRQEYKLWSSGKSCRITEERVKMLDELGFAWVAHRGGRKNKRRTSDKSNKKQKITTQDQLPRVPSVQLSSNTRCSKTHQRSETVKAPENFALNQGYQLRERVTPKDISNLHPRPGSDVIYHKTNNHQPIFRSRIRQSNPSSSSSSERQPRQMFCYRDDEHWRQPNHIPTQYQHQYYRSFPAQYPPHPDGIYLQSMGNDDTTPRVDAVFGRTDTKMNVKPSDIIWWDHFHDLKVFHRYHGHYVVPFDYPENLSLSDWITSQRIAYSLWRQGKPSSMTFDRYKALEELGFSFNASKNAYSEIPPPPSISEPQVLPSKNLHHPMNHEAPVRKCSTTTTPDISVVSSSSDNRDDKDDHTPRTTTLSSQSSSSSSSTDTTIGSITKSEEASNKSMIAAIALFDLASHRAPQVQDAHPYTVEKNIEACEQPHLNLPSQNFCLKPKRLF